MKRNITVLFSVISLVTGTAYASGITVKTTGNTVTVTAINEADSINAVRAVRKDGNASDKNDIFALKNVVADKDGNVVFDFVMPDEKNGVLTDGEYTVTVKQKGKEGESTDFVFVTSGNRSNALNVLKNSNDKLSVLEKTSEYCNALECAGINIDIFSEMPLLQKSDAVSIFEKSLNADDSDEEVVKKFENSVSVSNINKKQTGYIGNINPEFENESYNDIDSDAKIKWIDEYIFINAPYKSMDEFYSSYKNANMFYDINNARFDAVNDKIQLYAAFLGYEGDSTYNDYLDMSSSKRKKADEYITKKLSSSPVNSADGLLDIINDAMDSVTEKKQTGGGGGGSSSKGGGTYVPAVTAPEATKENTEKEEQNGFSDIPETHWAKDAVNFLADKDIVSGNGDGTFSPSRSVTREEFVKMLVMAYDLYDENAECEFDDVADDAWYYKYVASAVKAGIVAGVDYNKFGSGNVITRQDMAVMSYRVITKYGNISVNRDYNEFADEQNISGYAYESVKALYCGEILNGDEKEMFNPLGSTTRAEAATVIYKLIK